MHEVEIVGLAHGGSGVCRVDGQVCFVPYALPGERIRISVSRQTKGVLHAEIEDVLEPSPHRTETSCSVFGRCGGCTWLHFAYPAQADWKKRIVKDCFERIGKLEVDVAWLENPELRLGYRTRATFRGKDGRWGFYESGSHSLVDIESCPLCHPTLNDALVRLRTLKLDYPVEIVANPEGADVLVWSRSNSAELRQTFRASQSPADRAERARFVFDGIPVVNGTFSQSSLLLNRLLVKTVHRMAAGAVNVLDLYCGNGNLSLGLPDEVQIHGIDQNGAAVHGAKALGRGTFSSGEEPAFIRRIRKGGMDTVILDPPRAGAKRLVSSLRASEAERIVYVSCDPATLARDAAALVREKSWTLAEVIAIDMFPHTYHVETVALFQRD